VLQEERLVVEVKKIRADENLLWKFCMRRARKISRIPSTLLPADRLSKSMMSAVEAVAI
jgi:hypothetical protein